MQEADAKAKPATDGATKIASNDRNDRVPDRPRNAQYALPGTTLDYALENARSQLAALDTYAPT